MLIHDDDTRRRTMRCLSAADRSNSTRWIELYGARAKFRTYRTRQTYAPIGKLPRRYSRQRIEEAIRATRDPFYSLAVCRTVARYTRREPSLYLRPNHHNESDRLDENSFRRGFCSLTTPGFGYPHRCFMADSLGRPLPFFFRGAALTDWGNVGPRGLHPTKEQPWHPPTGTQINKRLEGTTSTTDIHLFASDRHMAEKAAGMQGRYEHPRAQTCVRVGRGNVGTGRHAGDSRPDKMGAATTMHLTRLGKCSPTSRALT